MVACAAITILCFKQMSHFLFPTCSTRDKTLNAVITVGHAAITTHCFFVAVVCLLVLAFFTLYSTIGFNKKDPGLHNFILLHLLQLTLSNSSEALLSSQCSDIINSK
jgi:hypothetical protein